MKRQTKIALVIIALVVSIAGTVACGWVSYEYAIGHDLFAGVAPALASTEEAQKSAAASKDDPGSQSQTHDDAADKSADTSGIDTQQSPEKQTQGDSQDTELSVSQVDESYAANISSENDNAANAPIDNDEADVRNINSVIDISVTIDASAVGGGAYTAVAQVSAGSTVYDALLASGANVNARATGFGMYVAAIDGVAEKEHGGMSGWVYAVNGIEPNTAASNFVVEAGDSVVWTYVNAEF